MIWKRLSNALRKRPELFLLLLAAGALQAEAQRRDPGYPYFVATHSNPNDYAAFATSGWDGNWYVGFNSAWVQKLPSLPAGPFAHAYIGAKLGRMKTLPPVGRPPVFEPVPGEIWMALSSTAAWPANRRVKLVTTKEIPQEGSPEYPLDQVGEAQWFWAEVPLDWVRPGQDHYLALWSPTPELLTISSAPVLAAALGGKEPGTFLINNLKGEPPTEPKDPPGTALTFFQPALAMKLIPKTTSAPVPTVKLVSWEPGTPAHPQPVLTADVAGSSIQSAWVEYLAPAQRRGDVVRPGWRRVGRPLWKTPFIFTLAQRELPPGKVELRITAVDIWERRGFSDAFTIEVSAVKAQK